MIEKQTGVVEAVVHTRAGAQEIRVRVGDSIRPAMNYLLLTGEVRPGDKVVLNTTALRLRFGTGGYDFVIQAMPERLPPIQAQSSEGLLMKLRYTPLQFAAPAAEEEHPEALEGDLEGLPVVACGLHSQLVPVLAGLRFKKQDVRAVYLMTDSAALPLSWSHLVAALRQRGWLVGTVTVGQAFGGDLEAVNLYSGLLLAKNRLGAEVVLVAQGPGNTGTHTRWGFSGIDQGLVLNATGTLRGVPIATLRLSFADPRERHCGISHHTLTVLSQVALVRCLVPLPFLSEVQAQFVQQQLERSAIPSRHEVCHYEAKPALEFMLKEAPPVTTMLRTPQDDPAFFLAACAAGLAAAERLS